METQLIRPFGPSILRAKIPDNLVNNLNEYIDKTVEDKKKLMNLIVEIN